MRKPRDRGGVSAWLPEDIDMLCAYEQRKPQIPVLVGFANNTQAAGLSMEPLVFFIHLLRTPHHGLVGGGLVPRGAG